MSSNVNSLPRQATSSVSVLEAQQGGSTRKVESLAKEKLQNAKSFALRHLSKNVSSNTGPTLSTNVSQAHVDKNNTPQLVSSTEQSGAAQINVGEVGRKAKQNKFTQFYLLRYKSSPDFLARDLNSFRRSLIKRQNSLVDKSLTLNDRGKALRKYLLLSILDTTEEEQSLRSLIVAAKTALRREHGKYLDEEFQKMQLAMETSSTPIEWRERVMAFAMSEAVDSSYLRPDNVFNLFKAIRQVAGDREFRKKLLGDLKQLEQILEKETKSKPTNATKYRQHILISQINQIKVILKSQVLHSRFIEHCQKIEIKNIPKTLDLAEIGFKIMASNEINLGLSELTKAVAGIESHKKDIKNVFITNYVNGVVKHRIFDSLYKSINQKVQIVDGLRKLTTAGSIFALGQSYEQ